MNEDAGLEREPDSSQFSVGDPVRLGPKESRTREYPPFMEEQQFFIQTIKPGHPCTPNTPRIFLTDCNGQFVVETDNEGRVINGRFDSKDFIPASGN